MLLAVIVVFRVEIAGFYGGRETSHKAQPRLSRSKVLTQTLWTALALVQHGILACRRLALLPDARDDAGLALALIASRVPLLAVLPTQRAVYRARFLTVAALQVLDLLYRVL